MIALIWATLLLADSSAGQRTRCQNDFCITLNEAEITAEAGLCVVIPCSFKPGYGFTPQTMVWFKCASSKPKCGDSDRIFHPNNIKEVQSGFGGRVSLLEPDVLLRNCSIVINDLTESDSGSYQFRINGLNGYGNQDGFTFSPRAAVSVKDLTQKPTVMVPPLTAGQQTTLTCTAPGLCSGSDPQFTWTWRGRGESDSHITGSITADITENLSALARRRSSTLTFNSSAEHHNTNVTCKVSFTNDITTEETVTLTVTYMRELAITGDTTIAEGDALNLTCSVESVPPSRIAWSSPSSNTNLHNEPHTGLQSDAGSATLLIHNVTTEHSGRYNCSAQHGDRTVTISADISVTKFPKILKSSGCRVQSEVLTCVCISEGPPLPTIRWPMLKNLTEYSVVTAVSKHTVNSTAILHVAEHGNNVVECFSSNENGAAKENLDIRTDASLQGGKSRDELVVYWLEIIIALFVGVLLSALIFCLTTKFRRIKQRKFGNLDETLEMVTNQEDPQEDVGRAAEGDRTYRQEEGGRAVTAANAALDHDAGPKDVEYANIDFSAVKRKREMAKRREATDTVYAEIKLMREEREECGGEGGETLEGMQNVAMMEEAEVVSCCAVEEVYSDPNEE